MPTPEEPPARPENLALTLTTGARQPVFCNSQVRGVPMVEARVGPPVAEVSSETARELDLEHGQRVRLRTAQGSLETRLYALPGLRPGVVRLPHCMVEANANLLTTIDGRDPATGFANFRAIPCALEPAAGALVTGRSPH